MDEETSTLTFEQFVSEATEQVRKGNSLSGVIVFSENDAWRNFERVISRFNIESRIWTADQIDTAQNDFFILRFTKRADATNRADARRRLFFIKVVTERESNQSCTTLYVFSYEGSELFRVFKSLVEKTRYMWRGWIGSRFLERFDEFVRSVYLKELGREGAEASTVLVKFVLETRDVKSKDRKGSSINYEKRSEEDLNKLRTFYWKEFAELLYVKKGKYKITTNARYFSVALSDRTEFTLMEGDLLEFLALFKYVLFYARELRDKFKKKILINKSQRAVRATNETLEFLSFDKIELIKIDVDNPVISSWRDNLVNTFSIDHLREFKLLNFVLQEGNPYFLAETIDLENGSRTYVSMVENSIRISPAIEQTEPSTISKLFSVLQSRVDPSINLIERW